MILMSNPLIDQTIFEEKKSNNALINNIMDQWSTVKQNREDNSDPYLEYLKSLDILGTQDPSGDKFSNYFRK